VITDVPGGKGGFPLPGGKIGRLCNLWGKEFIEGGHGRGRTKNKSTRKPKQKGKSHTTTALQEGVLEKRFYGRVGLVHSRCRT